jgi:hypothetical protein
VSSLPVQFARSRNLCHGPFFVANSATINSCARRHCCIVCGEYQRGARVSAEQPFMLAGIQGADLDDLAVTKMPLS